MITKALLDFLTGLLGVVIGWLPTSPPPGWVGNTAGMVASLMDYGSGLGAWINWPLMGIVAATIGGVMLLSFGIKVTRIVASFLTLGGGSAA
jgi:hypothetical protein